MERRCEGALDRSPIHQGDVQLISASRSTAAREVFAHAALRKPLTRLPGATSAFPPRSS